jgi:hypothetical protein
MSWAKFVNISVNGGYYIHYPDIRKTAQFISADGVHLTGLGNGIFLNTLPTCPISILPCLARKCLPQTCDLKPNEYHLASSWRLQMHFSLEKSGVSDDQIKMYGRWKSDAYARYIRIPQFHREVLCKLGGSLFNKGELFYISNPFLKVNFRYTGWSLDSWLFSSEKCICSRQEEARWYSFGFKSQVWGKHFLARQGRIEIGIYVYIYQFCYCRMNSANMSWAKFVNISVE